MHHPNFKPIIERLIEAVIHGGMIHNKDLRCSYDDYGTGASGMSPKPCTEYRRDKGTASWCAECYVRKTVEDARELLSKTDS